MADTAADALLAIQHATDFLDTAHPSALDLTHRQIIELADRLSRIGHRAFAASMARRTTANHTLTEV